MYIWSKREVNSYQKKIVLMSWQINEVHPANTKHLYDVFTMLDQRRRRWAGVVQMLYKCFVFARQ